MSRKKTFNEIIKAIPDLKSDKVEVISDELDKVLAIKKLFKSEGGEQLITLLRNNCSIALRRATSIARTEPKFETLLSAVLDYSSNMDLLASVQDISLEEELRLQLDEAVKEAMGR